MGLHGGPVAPAGSHVHQRASAMLLRKRPRCFWMSASEAAGRPGCSDRKATARRLLVAVHAELVLHLHDGHRLARLLVVLRPLALCGVAHCRVSAGALPSNEPASEEARLPKVHVLELGARRAHVEALWPSPQRQSERLRQTPTRPLATRALRACHAPARGTRRWARSRGSRRRRWAQSCRSPRRQSPASPAPAVARCVSRGRRAPAAREGRALGICSTVMWHCASRARGVSAARPRLTACGAGCQRRERDAPGA